MSSPIRSHTNSDVAHARIEDLYFGFDAGNVSLAGSGQSEPVVLVFLEVEVFTPFDQVVHFVFELVFIELLELFVVERVIIQLFQLLFEL